MYSNTNYFILGLIVEELTGQPLEQVVRERILDPLHLDATSFPTTPAVPEPSTSGTNVEIDEQFDVLQEQAFDLSPSAVWAAGAMISTVGDLERWAHALVSTARCCRRRRSVPGSRSSRRSGPASPTGIRSTRSRAPRDRRSRRAHGLGLFAAGGFIGHNGDIPGYEAVMMYDPISGTLIVETQNARLTQALPNVSPPGFDLELPSASVPTIAGVLGQDPPLPPNPDGPTTPPCAQPPPPPPPTTAPPPPSPPNRPPPSPPADAVVGRPPSPADACSAQSVADRVTCDWFRTRLVAGWHVSVPSGNRLQRRPRR